MENFIFCPVRIKYFLMHQAQLIVSAITPVSATAQFYLFLFTVSLTYQNLYSTPVRSVFISATPRMLESLATHIRHFCLRSHCISNSSKLGLSSFCMRQYYLCHVLVSSLLSPFGISYFYHLGKSASRKKPQSQVFL